MDINSAEPTCYRTYFLTPVPANKMSFFVHNTTRNAPYFHARFVSILELCRTFPIGHYNDKITLLNLYKYLCAQQFEAIVNMVHMLFEHGFQRNEL